MTKLPFSTCSAELAASHTPSNDFAQQELFGPLPFASKNPFAKPSSESTGPTRRSLTMSEPSTQMDLEELTLSRAAGRANLGVRPGSGEARKMTETSGRKWLGLLKSYGHAGLLARTCEALLTNQWGSSAAFLTWKASATKPSHLLLELAVSTPRTAAPASGLFLGTPTAAMSQRSAKFARKTQNPAEFVRDHPHLWLTPLVSDSEKRGVPKVGGGLAGQVHLWPTPTTPSGGGERSKDRAGTGDLHYMARSGQLWPTPVSRDYKGQGMSRERRETREPDNLCSWTAKYEGSAALNPAFVEWLMGFPAGWTNLTPQELQAVSKTESRGSRLSETPSSRKSSRKSVGRSSQRRTRDEC
jgi:hypothetical protein